MLKRTLKLYIVIIQYKYYCQLYIRGEKEKKKEVLGHLRSCQLLDRVLNSEKPAL